MKNKIFIIISGWLLILFSCTIPNLSQNPQTTQISTEQAPVSTPKSVRQTVVVTSSANSTPTPFLPLDPTEIVFTPTPEELPAWGNYAGPTVPSAVSIPPPVDPIKQPAGQVNILILGSDERPYGGGFRTDTILLLTLNPNQGTVNLTSFPRDLYVYIPGWTMQRINTSQQHGGFPLTQATFEYNFGIKPKYFVMVNFWAFVQAIDNLGGVNVNVGRTLTDHRDGYGNYTAWAGNVHMDGETALWYVRSRYSTSDFDRTRRQQEVLLAIFNRLVSLDGVKRTPELYNIYRNNVTTNIELENLTSLLGVAARISNEPNRLKGYAISQQQVTSYRVPTSGAQVLLPDRDEVLKIIRQAVNAP